MSTAPLPIFTIDEYLKLERAAEFRSEYLQGTIVAMAGAGRNHGWILGEAFAQLHAQLRGKSCGAATNDLRLYIEKYRVQQKHAHQIRSILPAKGFHGA